MYNIYYTYLLKTFEKNTAFYFGKDWSCDSSVDNPDYNQTVYYYGNNRFHGFVEIKQNLWIHEEFDHYIHDKDVLVCWVRKKASRNDLLQLLFRRSSLKGSYQRIPNEFMKWCGLPGVDEELCHTIDKTLNI